MNQLGGLLGSITKGNIVEALAMSEEPLTCYRISKLYNMNVAKTYATMKKLTALGLVRPTRGRTGAVYRLSDEDLRRLALKLSSRVITYEVWKSQEARSTRLRSGLARVPFVSLGRPDELAETKRSRIPGELENLALLARKKFDAKYLRTSGASYRTVR